MQLTATLPTIHISLPRRHAKRDAAVAAGSSSSARRAGCPQDNALYTCSCGCAFTAAVSTSVGCPHCGTDQAW